MNQLNLTDIRFNGPDYVPDRDNVRLKGQIEDVFKYMSDGAWHTLRDIATSTGHPEASVSAQLRHLRKKRFGSYTILKTYVNNGLFKYRLA